ncbi:hypothetical protein D3C86_1373180 [compost metagenome]
MDAAEIHRWCRHAELWIAEFALPQQAQATQFTDRIVHGFQGAVAQARVRGMPALPEDVDALHHDAFVHADRLEPGRLADHRRPPQRSPRLGQRAGTGHRTFFIAGGENQQRLFERLIEQRFDRLDGQGEKTLHIATAQADPTTVDFSQLQRVGLPQRAVERHGVAVPGQHQAAGAGAETGQQVELAGADLLDLAGKAQLTEPRCQQIDDRAVGLIETGLCATDRRCGDQRSELFFHRRQWHR